MYSRRKAGRTSFRRRSQPACVGLSARRLVGSSARRLRPRGRRPHACRRRAGIGESALRGCVVFSPFLLVAVALRRRSGYWQAAIVPGGAYSIILVSSGGIFPSSFSLLFPPFLLFKNSAPRAKQLPLKDGIRILNTA